MSCSCCCCVTPGGELLEGIRKKERLVRGGGEEEEEEEEAGAGREEESRRNMEISLLREQYRCTRERQKRHTQVLLFRKVSDDVSEAVSVVPVAQGLTSPWEPNSSSQPAITFDPAPATYNPWHIHLGLHRRSCPGVAAQLTASSPETTNSYSSSRWSSSSSEAVGSRQDVDSTPDPPGSSSETSPCSSFSTKEEDVLNADGSRGDPDQMDPVQVSVSGSLDASEPTPSEDLSGSDESSTPVASVSCSPSSSTTSLHEDLRENPPAGDGVLQAGGASMLRGSRKFSAPALRFTRQLSVGGVGSSTGVHQNQNYHPFPNRKPPRISEAARRLGMYSSF